MGLIINKINFEEEEKMKVSFEDVSLSREEVEANMGDFLVGIDSSREEMEFSFIESNISGNAMEVDDDELLGRDAIALEEQFANEQLRKDSLETANLRIFGKLQDAMELARLTQVTEMEDVQFLLANENHSEEDINVIDSMLDEGSMFIPNTDLERIFKLEVCQPDEVWEDGYHFYLRRWSFTIEEFGGIVEYILDNKMWRTALEWQEKIRNCQPMEIISVDRIGQTQGPGTVYDRHQEDLVYRKTGFFSGFLNALSNICPRPPTLYRFSGASFGLWKTQDDADLRERYLIQLFGLRTLLNIQRGGFYHDYVPDASDLDYFKALGVQYFKQIDEYSDDVPLHELLRYRRAARTWATLWRDYTLEYPVLTGTLYGPWSEQHFEMLAKQATPTMIPTNGGTVRLPLLIAGKDITARDYLMSRPFLPQDYGQSQAGRLTWEILHRFWTIETGPVVAGNGGDDPPFFPFIDIFNCPNHDPDEENSDDDAMPLLDEPGLQSRPSRPVHLKNADTETNVTHCLQKMRWYIEKMRPLVIACLGDAVHRTSERGFKFLDATPERDFIAKQVGVVRIVCTGVATDIDEAGLPTIAGTWQ